MSACGKAVVGDDGHLSRRGQVCPNSIMDARSLVVGKARHPHSHRARVRAHLVFAEVEILRAERVADLDCFVTSLHFVVRHRGQVRLIMRWSTWATTSWCWFSSVVRTITKTIEPVRPVFS